MKKIKSELVEKLVRSYLKKNGYCLSKKKKHGETGPDVIAEKKNEKVFIEIIGFNSKPSIKSREFYECFFRVISRYDKNKNTIIVIALPHKGFFTGMPQRVAAHGEGWLEIGKAFPNLQIWYVKTDDNSIDKFSWLKPF